MRLASGGELRRRNSFFLSERLTAQRGEKYDGNSGTERNDRGGNVGAC